MSFGLFLLPSRLSREEEKERKKKIKYEQKKTDKIQRKTPIFTIYLTVQSAFVSRHYKTSIVWVVRPDLSHDIFCITLMISK